MEVYYKDLISAEATLDELVDNLMLVVQGAEEFAAANGAIWPEEKQREIADRLAVLKQGCLRLKRQAMATARATDAVLHRYPWPAAAFAFGAGILAGVVLGKLRSR